MRIGRNIRPNNIAVRRVYVGCIYTYTPKGTERAYPTKTLPAGSRVVVSSAGRPGSQFAWVRGVSSRKLTQPVLVSVVSLNPMRQG